MVESKIYIFLGFLKLRSKWASKIQIYACVESKNIPNTLNKIFKALVSILVFQEHLSYFREIILQNWRKKILLWPLGKNMSRNI